MIDEWHHLYKKIYMTCKMMKMPFVPHPPHTFLTTLPTPAPHQTSPCARRTTPPTLPRTTDAIPAPPLSWASPPSAAATLSHTPHARRPRFSGAWDTTTVPTAQSRADPQSSTKIENPTHLAHWYTFDAH